MGDDEGDLPKAVAAAGGSVWAPRYDQLTSGVIREAHACGLEVTPWTVDRNADIQHCLKMGVDGIISNRPDRVKRILAD
jgi:glycerophosphoryl diester phosphodiesterase